MSNVIFVDDNDGYVYDDDGLDDDAWSVEQARKKANAQSFQTAPQVLSQTTPGGVYLDTVYPPNPPFEHSPLPAHVPQSQQINIPTPGNTGGGPGEPLILSSQDFRVSLSGDDGPSEYADIAHAADNLTTPFEDARNIQGFYEREYGIPYRPFEPGIPNYTGDFGFPVVDPNPGSCRLGFMKDLYGRCISIDWFNLPPPPTMPPEFVSGSNNPIPGPGGQALCPDGQFLANDGKCYPYPAPPVLLPPPPSNVSGSNNVSGSSSFARALVGFRINDGRRRLNNNNVRRSYYQESTVFPELLNDRRTEPSDALADRSRIVQVYVSNREAALGDRIDIESSIQLFNTEKSYRVNLVIPEFGINVATPQIKPEFEGVVDVVQSDFDVPQDLSIVDKHYNGEVQLWAGDKLKDRQIFSIFVF